MDIVMATALKTAEIIELGSLTFSLAISVICLVSLFSSRIKHLFNLSLDFEKAESV
jgi:hypothetical protein